jgi:hypothetical protein
MVDGEVSNIDRRINVVGYSKKVLSSERLTLGIDFHPHFNTPIQSLSRVNATWSLRVA